VEAWTLIEQNNIGMEVASLVPSVALVAAAEAGGFDRRCAPAYRPEAVCTDRKGITVT
jgi:hypothetical protein